MKKKSESSVILIGLFVFLVMILAVFMVFKGINLKSIFNPAPQWKSLDVDVDKEILQSNENQVIVSVDAIRDFDDKGYCSFIYIWIIKNNEVQTYVHEVSQKTFSNKYVVEDFNDGYNNIKVKVGLRPWTSIAEGKDDGTRHCDDTSISWKYLRGCQGEELRDYYCSLIKSAYGQGYHNLYSLDAPNLNEDYSLQIRKLTVKQFNYNVYKEINEEIPALPEEEIELPCRKFWIICWDWLIDLFYS